MPNHKLFKNVCVKKNRSVVQYTMMSRTDFTVLIYTVGNRMYLWVVRPGDECSYFMYGSF
jgi:hypothetical protein